MKFTVAGNWVNIDFDDNDERVVMQDQFDQSMRFQPVGYDRTDTFKKGTWDGYVRLFEFEQIGRKKARFPRGLLQRALLICRLAKVKMFPVVSGTVVQKRDLKRFPVFDAVLHPFQVEIKDRALVTGGGTVCLPTGCGKTMLGLALVQALCVPTVILVHRKELLVQWRNRIATILRVPRDRIGMIGSGVSQMRPDINVAMVQTVDRQPPGFLNDFELLIFDECHHVPSSTIFDVAMKAGAPYVYGLTATPRREDGTEMKIFAAVGPLLSQKTWSDMIGLGYLSKPTILMLPVPYIHFGRKYPYADVYRHGIVVNHDRNKLVLEVVGKLRARGHTSIYVHVKQIDHGEILKGLLTEHGAVWIHGKTPAPERREALVRFGRDGGLLISTLLGEGVDIPNMDALVLAGGGKSLTATQQVIGRVLRTAKKKAGCVVVDFHDRCKYLFEHFQERESWYRSEPAFEIKEDL